MLLRRKKDPRSLSFARLFETLQEGVYIGRIGAAGTTTLSANPQLRLMFGWAADLPTSDIRPLDADRFVDDQARGEFLQDLARDGQVRGYVLRLRRADGSAIWAEVTARAEAVVVNTSGCGAHMKAYGHLLAGDSAYAERARRFAASVRDLAEILAQEEERRLVRMALAKMNERQSQLLILRHSGLSYKEIAKTLELAPTSIGPLLLRAEREFEKQFRALAKEEG